MPCWVSRNFNRDETAEQHLLRTWDGVQRQQEAGVDSDYWHADPDVRRSLDQVHGNAHQENAVRSYQVALGRQHVRTIEGAAAFNEWLAANTPNDLALPNATWASWLEVPLAELTKQEPTQEETMEALMRKAYYGKL